MAPQRDQGPETSDSEEGFSLWGRRVASTRCRGYWSLEDRVLLTGARAGRGRDQAQRWESKQCLARSGLTPPKRCDLTSLIILSGSASVSHSMCKLVSKGVLVPYRNPGGPEAQGLGGEKLTGCGKRS